MRTPVNGVHTSGSQYPAKRVLDIVNEELVTVLGGQTRRLAPQFSDWVESFVWAPDSKSIDFTAPDKSNVAIYEVGIGGGEPNKLYSSGAADALSVSRDGQTIYFDQSTLSRPTDIWALRKVTGRAAAKPDS